MQISEQVSFVWHSSFEGSHIATLNRATVAIVYKATTGEYLVKVVPCLDSPFVGSLNSPDEAKIKAEEYARQYFSSAGVVIKKD